MWRIPAGLGVDTAPIGNVYYTSVITRNSDPADVWPGGCTPIGPHPPLTRL